ncbi:MAG: tripartite tricarboxylate transporter substrate binding protein [Burkholderiales bacterium]|nr:tripartite tricarboxylate transporter substrate binding protein [Burkholderiales bacterium]
MTPDRRRLLGLLASLPLLPAPLRAQAWPSRALRIITPFAAGGATDIYARGLAQGLQAALGQAVVVDNRPGGNFAIGTEAAAKAEPDGHSLFTVTSSHAVLEVLGVNRDKYQLMRDFTPVAALNTTTCVLVVHPSVPANSVRELVALAKAKPGQLNYSSTGSGGMLHLAGELFKSLSGADITHVPYKTGGTARVDLMSGRVQLMFDTLTDAAANVRAGKLRALATCGAKRSPLFPDLPTIAEAGVPGYELPVLIGIMAPTGTPRAAVERLNREIGRLVMQPELRDAWLKMGAESTVMTPEELGRALAADIDKWGRLIKSAKIVVE